MFIKFLELTIAILAGGFALFYILQGLSSLINSKEVDGFLNPPIKPYSYKESELWEAPSYWKNFEKN